MPDTTLGITYPSLTDTPDGPAQMQVIAEDVDALIAADRAARDGVWSAYTPAFTGSTSGTGTNGNGVNASRYTRIGRTVHVMFDFTLGTTSSLSVTGSLLCSLPVTARAITPGHLGSGLLIDASPTAREGYTVEFQTTTTVILVRGDDGAIATSTSPITWATGDVIRWHGTYESASAP